MTRNDATERQVRAADPAASTWVEANAGSGKTRVLTDRVARLLLAGTNPQHILCLTYTKAAASEMQNRLFERLGRWAMLPGGELARALQDLGVEGGMDGQRLAAARRLFARAIETPGGLRIQTIHAFCASILRRFPMEAGLSPQFAEMEEREADLLMAGIADEMAVEVPDLVAGVAGLVSDEDLSAILGTVTGMREAIAAAPDEDGLRRALGLAPGESLEALVARTLAPGDGDLLRRVAAACAAGSKTDLALAATLSRVAAEPGAEDLPILEGCLLTGAKAAVPFGAKTGKIPTKKIREAHPEMAGDLDDLMERVAAARETRLRLLAAERTATVLRFGTEFLRRYEDAKLAAGLVDFDDLIARTRALLTDPRVCDWVLYRLDGGIDHILVDESQDTSPAQWAVVKELAREFTAGDGAQGSGRTIFVVGDRKQSIYSFQGADTAGFDAARAHFEARLAEAGARLESVGLIWSFRSAQEILRLVDDTFREGRSDGIGDPPEHLAFRDAMPGRVDLWPAVPKPEKEEEPPWFAPLDRLGRSDPKVVLAEALAAEILRMTREETLPVETKSGMRRRRVTEGDILILVRGRQSGLFGHIIRACKAAGLDVAGADRLKLMAELAVRDLVAVLRFLSLADDNLSLAAALRSPLFGWDEGQLYRLAAGRRSTLWQRLRATPCEALRILDDLRDRADFLRPFDLLNRLLLRHDGRRRLLARLGPEAEDGIDQLLSQALAYERRGVPSLTGFLEWLDAEDVTVKRQSEGAGRQLRVMTVHGSKGLEAPIVVLPDCATPQAPKTGRALMLGEAPVWAGTVDEMPPEIAAARAERQAAQEEERRRLLYVAMTRAESWLIVCAAGDAKEGEGSWHGMVSDGMRHGGAVDHATPVGPGLRAQRADWDDLPMDDAPGPAARPLPPPPAYGPAPVPPRPALLSPSDLGGAKVLPGETDGAEGETALALGRLVHMLLEVLPEIAEADRPAMGLSLIEAHPDAAASVDPAALVAEVAALTGRPDLAPLFAAGALVEAPLSAPAPGGRRIVGTVDRLIVSEDRILAVDYKTNRLVPGAPEDVPEGVLRQMGAYDHALTQVFPGRAVETAILWTRTGALMVLPQHLVRGAWARAMAALTGPEAVHTFRA